MKARILVADDEETVREELCEALRDAGFEVVAAGNGREAIEAARLQYFDVCISDIKMPIMDGLELLRRLTEESPETLVIMVTAYGDMDTAIAALRSGATDYVLKPVLFDDILSKVTRLVEQRCMARELVTLRRIAEQSFPKPSRGMVGESGPMRELARVIAKVGPTRSSVLILGASGTGKELIARAIHEAGDRAEAPFVPINCAAIPEMLLESELFGHVKGSFTSAVANKEGLLKTAGDGTIFLDEIGDMPMSLQAKLLRALESREIQPVGSVKRIPFSARIIAATNKDLEKRIADGQFREDLYYRLAVVEIPVPALRERREDIPLLVRHFVDKYKNELRRNCTGIDPAALQRLVGYDWKGNIRELENTIERALIFAEGDVIQVADLPENVRGATPVDPGETLDLTGACRRFERDHIQRVLDACHGDKREAAKLLAVSLSSLYRKLDGSE